MGFSNIPNREKIRDELHAAVRSRWTCVSRARRQPAARVVSTLLNINVAKKIGLRYFADKEFSPLRRKFKGE